MQQWRSPDFLSTLILAGGRSFRMGRDKALIEVDGIPMLRRVYNAAADCTDQVWVVTPWRSRYVNILPPTCLWIDEPSNAEQLQGEGDDDIDPATGEAGVVKESLRRTVSGTLDTRMNPRTTPIRQGPLIGFVYGLEVLTAHGQMPEWVLLLACDLPLLRSEVLADWIASLPDVDEGVSAVLPHHSKGWEALCGFYRTRCFHDLQAYVSAGGRSFQRWLHTQTVETLPLPDVGMMMNCNTPDDLATLDVQDRGER